MPELVEQDLRVADADVRRRAIHGSGKHRHQHRDRRREGAIGAGRRRVGLEKVHEPDGARHLAVPVPRVPQACPELLAGRVVDQRERPHVLTPALPPGRSSTRIPNTSRARRNSPSVTASTVRYARTAS